MNEFNGLSLRAIGLLVHAGALCAGDKVRINVEDISREVKEGQSAIRTALGELCAAGVLEYCQPRENGKMCPAFYEVKKGLLVKRKG